MKILVAIANYGNKNDQYLQRLLQEYRSMSYDVHVVVLSNMPKSLGDDIEVVVEIPRGDPWSFPFAHKKIFADRVNEYDLFIYTEDDTLITERNIQAFLKVTEALPDDEIAGFVRSEERPDGTINIPTAHGPFHWDPRSVVSRGDHVFAFFTNEHSAAYLITKWQLNRAITSGGFLVVPHEEKYDLLVTAATDPYTQCGFRKMICISQINDFILPHLANKYVGTWGPSQAEFFRQIEALQLIHEQKRPCTLLLNGQTKLKECKWSKNYYEPPNADIVALIPSKTRKILTYGCACGSLEADLVKRGFQVTAIALDSVIGIHAEDRGIEVIYGDAEAALVQLAGAHFDCILLSTVLHLVSEPEKLLSSLASLLPPGGNIIASTNNLGLLQIIWFRLAGKISLAGLTSHRHTGINLTSYRVIRKWLRSAGLKVRKVSPVIPQRAMWLNRISSGLLEFLLAEEFSILAERT